MNQDIISEITSKPILHWNARNFTELPPELLHYGSQTEEIYLRWNNIYSMVSIFIKFSAKIYKLVEISSQHGWGLPLKV